MKSRQCPPHHLLGLGLVHEMKDIRFFMLVYFSAKNYVIPSKKRNPATTKDSRPVTVQSSTTPIHLSDDIRMNQLDE